MGFKGNTLLIGFAVSVLMSTSAFAKDAEHNVTFGTKTSPEPWYLTLSSCAGQLLFISQHYEIKDEKLRKVLGDNASMLATVARDRLVIDRKIGAEEANKIALAATSESSNHEWNAYWTWRAANMLDQKRNEKVGQCSKYFQEYVTTFPELFGKK